MKRSKVCFFEKKQQKTFANWRRVTGRIGGGGWHWTLSSVVRELKAAGFTDAQGQAVTRVVRNAQEVDISNLATKTDLFAVKTDLAAVKSDLELRLAELKAEILQWLLGSIGIQTVVIIGAVVALVHSVAH
jgi:hypothetical protein